MHFFREGFAATATYHSGLPDRQYLFPELVFVLKNGQAGCHSRTFAVLSICTVYHRFSEHLQASSCHQKCLLPKLQILVTVHLWHFLNTCPHLKSLGDAGNLGRRALLVLRLRLRKLLLLALGRQSPDCWQHCHQQQRQKLENKHPACAGSSNAENQTKSHHKVSQPISGNKGQKLTSLGCKLSTAQVGCSPTTVGGSGWARRLPLEAHSNLKRHQPVM